MPYVHRERRMNGGGPLNAYPDELPNLWEACIRAVVSLLNIPSDAAVYESAGFSFLCLPVPDGHAPTMEQATKFTQFMIAQRIAHRPVAVHCEAGIGRTGTMIATYLISQGDDARSAINKVRAVEPRAIETPRQIEFLENFARQGLKTIRFEGELLPKWAHLLDVAAIICSAPEVTQCWFSRFTHSPGVEEASIIVLQCKLLQTAIRQRKDWLALQLNQSQDPQQVSQIIAALEYSLDTMLQQTLSKKTCSWTQDGFQSDPRGDFGDGDITLRRV